eukprot:gene16521-22748_t
MLMTRGLLEIAGAFNMQFFLRWAKLANNCWPVSAMLRLSASNVRISTSTRAGKASRGGRATASGNFLPSDGDLKPLGHRLLDQYSPPDESSDEVPFAPRVKPNRPHGLKLTLKKLSVRKPTSSKADVQKAGASVELQKEMPEDKGLDAEEAAGRADIKKTGYLLRIGRSSDVKGTAGSIAKCIRLHEKVMVIAAGQWAICNTLKAIATARQFVAESDSFDIATIAGLPTPVEKEEQKRQRDLLLIDQAKIKLKQKLLKKPWLKGKISGATVALKADISDTPDLFSQWVGQQSNPRELTSLICYTARGPDPSQAKQTPGGPDRGPKYSSYGRTAKCVGRLNKQGATPLCAVSAAGADNLIKTIFSVASARHELDMGQAKQGMALPTPTQPSRTPRGMVNPPSLGLRPPQGGRGGGQGDPRTEFRMLQFGLGVIPVGALDKVGGVGLYGEQGSKTVRLERKDQNRTPARADTRHIARHRSNKRQPGPAPTEEPAQWGSDSVLVDGDGDDLITPMM